MPELDPWDTWFNAQYELTDLVREHLKQYSNKSNAFKAALIFGVMESLSEDVRQYLELPPSDAAKFTDESIATEPLATESS